MELKRFCMYCYRQQTLPLAQFMKMYQLPPYSFTVQFCAIFFPCLHMFYLALIE